MIKGKNFNFTEMSDHGVKLNLKILKVGLKIRNIWGNTN